MRLLGFQCSLATPVVSTVLDTAPTLLRSCLQPHLPPPASCPRSWVALCACAALPVLACTSACIDRHRFVVSLLLVFLECTSRVPELAADLAAAGR
eukprot:scaffold57904_cov64-Phaeocystis_antarctica.AAC.2